MAIIKANDVGEGFEKIVKFVGIDDEIFGKKCYRFIDKEGNFYHSTCIEQGKMP